MNPQRELDHFVVWPFSLHNLNDLETCQCEIQMVIVDEHVYCVARGAATSIALLIDGLHPAPPFGARRLMDRVVLVETPEGFWAAGSAFFQVTAAEYELFISPERNEACAKALVQSSTEAFESLCGTSKPKETLRALDFGCGTGVSSRILRGEGMKVTSYDCCPAMREQACRSGYSVISELSACETGTIDTAIACYVLHFGVRITDASELFRIIVPGGIFAANFHKGLELGAASTLMKSSGFTLVEEMSKVFSDFGPILLFRRDS